MKYPTDVPAKIVMLGAGGTGGHIAPHLYRLLYALNRPGRFILCDGDIVEQKNLIRQNFSPADLGENKARVLVERYASVFGMEAEYVPNFVENLETLEALIMPKEWQLDPRIYRFVKEMVILIGAVDNNKSRQLCHQAFLPSGGTAQAGRDTTAVSRPVCSFFLSIIFALWCAGRPMLLLLPAATAVLDAMLHYINQIKANIM